MANVYTERFASERQYTIRLAILLRAGCLTETGWDAKDGLFFIRWTLVQPGAAAV